MGFITQPANSQARGALELKSAVQELQQRNRALANARVQLTRMRRQQQALEQQFEEVRRASEQWLKQARRHGQEHELRALSYLRRHNAAALQLSALAQRIGQHSASLNRHLALISELEAHLQAAMQLLKRLEANCALTTDEQKTEPYLTMNSMLEPWELRLERTTEFSAGDFNAGANSISEYDGARRGQQDVDLLEQLAGLLERQE